MRKPLTEVWLSKKNLDLMIAEARQFVPKETGGVFMGYRTRDSVVITDMFGSGPNAIHAPTFYRPDLAHERSEIERIYEQSNRMHSYLGDWHTHPSGLLRLSRKDKIALRTVANCREARAERPITAILAGRDERWQFHIWEYAKSAIPFLGIKTVSTRLHIY
jgi:integrative and conjugative element protein (TIGR02256 family)